MPRELARICRTRAPAAGLLMDAPLRPFYLSAGNLASVRGTQGRLNAQTRPWINLMPPTSRYTAFGRSHVEESIATLAKR